MAWKIPLFKIYHDKSDIKAITKAVKSETNWAIGSNVSKFEKLLAKYMGVKYALLFNSGTSALHALLMAFDVDCKNEVIVPSFTFISTANSPLFVGAKPIFAEIEEETFGLDPKDVEKKISKKTKAIIPIHYGGCPCKIQELKKIAKRHNLVLIEDAAESMGAKIGKRKIGTFGDAAMLSFCQNKIITTGEGGAALTNSRSIYEKLKLIRSHGRVETKNYFSFAQYMDYVTLGYNFRMSNITAALGLTQLKKIDKIIRRRKINAEYFNKKLSKIKGLTLQNPPENYLHVHQMYTIKIKKGKKIRNALKNYLSKKGIETRVCFHPVHLTGFYNSLGYKKGYLPITERISSQVLTLPFYPAIKKKEIDYIAKEINYFFKNYA